LFYRFKKLRKMKKLVFMFVAVAAISFASCGNKTAQAEAVDSDSIAVVDSADVDTVAADTVAADSTAATAAAE
jgi:ABC-type oligopeptide transport system substrate-binding subunit